MFIATLIAANSFESGELSASRDRLADAGCEPGETNWLVDGKAADIPFGNDLVAARAALAPLTDGLDIFVQRESEREKHMLISDMDSTMISAECIDELADYAGLKAEVSAVTERAMRGELDFFAALKSRVALLEGLSESVIAECLAERVRPMAGAKTLVATLRSRGCHCVLISGGFHHFADPVAADIGFDVAIANRLAIANRKLTGGLEGEIVDAARKQRALQEIARKRSLPLSTTLAIGDGANDIPMLEMAGFGIAYRAKPAAKEAADAFIAHGDLTHALFALGIVPRHWSID